MASRVSPEVFFATAKRMFPLADMAAMSIENIVVVAQANDWLAPMYYRKNKNVDGTFSIIPEGSTDEGSTPDSGNTYHISITPQSPEGRFLSPKGDPKVAELHSRIRNGLSRATAMSPATIDPNVLFGHLADLTALLLEDITRALLVYGGPGVGKTVTVTSTIEESGLVKNVDWFHIKGKITPSALFQTLFLHRKGKLVVFDDADSVFNSEDAVNILKGALDTSDERFISWASIRTVNVAQMDSTQRDKLEMEVEAQLLANPGDPSVKYPSEFRYEGRIIFISNLPRHKIDSAVLSRSQKIDMTLTDAQVFMRIESIIDLLGGDTTREKKFEILAILKDKHSSGQLTKIDLRTFTIACNIARSGKSNWFDLLQYQ